MQFSPGREILAVKKDLKNDEIDKKVAKAFNVSNSA